MTRRFYVICSLVCALVSGCIQTKQGPKGAQVVDIEDQHNNMEYFRNHMLELFAGKRKKVRIAYYSDSNNSLDYASGYLRGYLGRTFGYGGHGYILGGKPLSYYQHRDIKIYNRYGWRGYQLTVPKTRYFPYGHGGGVGIGYGKGAYVRYKSHSGPNSHFSSIAVHVWCNSHSSFNIVVDGKIVKSVVNRCKPKQLKVIHTRVPIGQHEVRLVATDPNVVILGTSFERDRGVVVDGFGVGGANIWNFSVIPEITFLNGMKARDYSLVILHLGTNLVPNIRRHAKWMNKVISRIRKALGYKVSILVLSPPPRGFRRFGKILTHRYPARVALEKRRIALGNRCAYWDYLKASGGPGSIDFWYRKGFFYRDLIHSAPGFHKHMGALLYNALVRNFFSPRRKP